MKSAGAASGWISSAPWLSQPVIVVMGAPAIRGVNGRTLMIAKTRGRLIPLPDSIDMVVTVHPPHLLRVPDVAENAGNIGYLCVT